MLGQAEVELDVFSGAPNPTWTLTDRETEALIERLARLPPAKASTLMGNLGYRGFIVYVTPELDPQLIRVQAGIVEISGGASSSYRRDRGRSLERWLLNTGRPFVKKELLQAVENALR